MFFRQIQVQGLGCLSYVLGCPQAGTMIVVDPKRDIQDYLDISRDEGMRITHIVDTHVHADHVSGAHELASRTGAEICMHPDSPVDFTFTPLPEGHVLQAGNARLRVLHTPGHTPHSISLVVSDLARSEEPWMLLTGDLLFVGDIGRPDLAGSEILDAQVKNLYNSLFEKVGGLPEFLEVYPAHGAGSLCGKGMSPKNSSTLGYEMRHNPRLQYGSFEEFAGEMGGEFPLRPKSFTHIISTNMNGAPLLDRCPLERALTVSDFEKLMAEGAVVIDTRDGPAFGGSHIPGSLNIGFEKSMANWVGMVVDPKADILLVVQDRPAYDAMRTELHRIGYDNILGYLSGGIQAWIFAGKPVDKLEQVSGAELAERLQNGDRPALLDVRTDAEWDGGFIHGAQHMSFNEILDACCSLPTDEEVVVYCGSGYRSNMAGSYMQAHGYANVKSLAGGVMAWSRAGRQLSADL
ncbi:MBL fold metallo-hydrolase [Oceanidesulfovibrio marinus]|uniref:MBL fold metallo-hydrolase n=1 Tax=Oceanidesulfovibrio marinus TaxID=370038 RepID=A0A6P1ZCG9_9BACT|nr:MBL fold metallo-hydrolase [Oceanidesulfovibrio marinus]TVM31897.1 MBL fold metallo-hydrolase [Oceanidesulfovibrio marinus]